MDKKEYFEEFENQLETSDIASYKYMVKDSTSRSELRKYEIFVKSGYDVRDTKERLVDRFPIKEIKLVKDKKLEVSCNYDESISPDYQI